jgi:hypothetical protein
MRYKIQIMLSKIVLIAIISFTFIANNCGEKAGEGEVAKRGYATAQPVIDALEKYRQETGKYPDTWVKLIPNYLKELPKDTDGLRYSYLYNESKNMFVLEFTYDGTGVVGITECNYYSNTKSWSCGGKV